MYQSMALQANSEGITWLNAAGDTGAGDCEDQDAVIAQDGLAVDAPGSVPEVTAMGGSEFNEGSGNYWSSTNSATQASALSYIPETVWNDTNIGYGLQGGGRRWNQHLFSETGLANRARGSEQQLSQCSRSFHRCLARSRRLLRLHRRRAADLRWNVHGRRRPWPESSRCSTSIWFPRARKPSRTCEYQSRAVPAGSEHAAVFFTILRWAITMFRA